MSPFNIEPMDESMFLSTLLSVNLVYFVKISLKISNIFLYVDKIEIMKF